MNIIYKKLQLTLLPKNISSSVYIHNFGVMVSQQGNKKGAPAATDNDISRYNVAAHIVETKRKIFLVGWKIQVRDISSTML